MNAKVKKQYLLLKEKPVLYYSLRAFEESPVTDVVLVSGADEIEYCKKEIVERYGFRKVTAVVAGGKERYHSVFEGLKAAGEPDYVLIHDGARPFLTEDILRRAMDGVQKYRACVVGMPVKDTIKIADGDGYSKETPERKKVWMIQTPQCFEYRLIYDAYEKMLAQEDEAITDDAMVLERVHGLPVKLIEGSYQNIKITTPDDMVVANAYLQECARKKTTKN